MRLPSPRRLATRVLLGFWTVQVLAALSLMIATSLRKLWRGAGVAQLPQTAPHHIDLAQGSNSVEVYTSGGPLYEAMLEAIDGARHRILLESYIIKADVLGRRFKAALQRAAGRGVQVWVIYDGFANLVVPPSFFDFGPGIEVLRYPVFARVPWTPRNLGRDHRKLLVVDDEVGFVGGYNIGSLYATEWRDTHLSVRGPAVWDLANVFVDFWTARRPECAPQEEGTSAWNPALRVHRNVPRQLIFPIRAMYLEAIDRAQSTIDMTTAYFIPDQDVLAALVAASRRGVRVRILLPKVSNHVVSDFLARGFFNELLAADVEIWRYADHMVHAKTATIDQQWTTIGTANIDRLSLTGNYEINVELFDAELGAQMASIFEADLTRAEQLTGARWGRRPIVARIYETILAPLKPLL